jgi:hypothetical protein
MQTPRLWLVALSGTLLLQLAGCTLKGTIKETTDTTSNITGTTSGRAWWNEDGHLNAEYKAIAFATYNQANLEQDLARGEGEYLASLGTLLGVSDAQAPTFQGGAQADFSSLLRFDDATRLSRLRLLAQ